MKEVKNITQVQKMTMSIQPSKLTKHFGCLHSSLQQQRWLCLELQTPTDRISTFHIVCIFSFLERNTKNRENETKPF